MGRHFFAGLIHAGSMRDPEEMSSEFDGLADNWHWQQR